MTRKPSFVAAGTIFVFLCALISYNASAFDEVCEYGCQLNTCYYFVGSGGPNNSGNCTVFDSAQCISDACVFSAMGNCTGTTGSTKQYELANCEFDSPCTSCNVGTESALSVTNCDVQNAVFKGTFENTYCKAE
jgi:hypothetical protein